ncbi:ArdC family protein [Bradyrhizobium brasilense]|nr:zincin-like metallopeptidase domain-containing protein [Bradyrhizobium brasilense]
MRALRQFKREIMTKSARDRFDVHQDITSRIVQAIEAGAGTFVLPWHQGASTKTPVNATTQRAYRGVNVLSLWITAQALGYRSHQWATFKQWQSSGAQVRKGEKGTPIVFYKTLEIQNPEPEQGQGEDAHSIPFARASWVFNAEQVDGFAAATPERPTAPLFERLEQAEKAIAATGAAIEYGGTQAFYDRKADRIRVPDPSAFLGSPTSSPQESFYSTVLHELTHFSGAPHRLNRENGKRFADKPYCFEELIAELGAAFLCAELGITNEPRPDHAQYIAQYLAILKEDKRAIFQAATAATAATAYLLAFSSQSQESAA